jgi:oligopeptide/dipeptide ABC transporter ATP-binding protein
MSVGMAQRVLIAMALLHKPDLLIADEPTSGLDVTIQAQVLELIMTLVHEHGTTLWLITHDLGLIANYCDRAAVMFAGLVIEQGSVKQLFDATRHPYTVGLLDAGLSRGLATERLRITGPPPDLASPSPGCLFSYRCPWSETHCTLERPSLEPIGTAHDVRCFVAHRRAIDSQARLHD